jgi:hypothetical protein
MPASNIKSVVLNRDGSVTIEGEVAIERELANLKDYDVKLLHVWFAATGKPAVNGAGLAIDCCQKQKGVKFNGKKFKITAKGAANAKFGRGPGTVSAIAVLSPKKAGVPAEVIQWSRTVTLA